MQIIVQSYANILDLATKNAYFYTFLLKYLLILRANALHLSNISTFGRRLGPKCVNFPKNLTIWTNSPEATFAKCCKYALFFIQKYIFY